MSSTPTMSDEERAEAIEKRREERRAKRLQQARDRISTYRKWVEDDYDITVRRRAAEAAGEPLPPRLRMPEIPTDTDYTLVREQEDAS